MSADLTERFLVGLLGATTGQSGRFTSSDEKARIHPVMGSDLDPRKVQEAVDYVLNSNLSWPEYVMQLALAAQEWLSQKPRGSLCD